MSSASVYLIIMLFVVIGIPLSLWVYLFFDDKISNSTAYIEYECRKKLKKELIVYYYNAISDNNLIKAEQYSDQLLAAGYAVKAVKQRK